MCLVMNDSIEKDDLASEAMRLPSSQKINSLKHNITDQIKKCKNNFKMDSISRIKSNLRLPYVI